MSYSRLFFEKSKLCLRKLIFWCLQRKIQMRVMLPLTHMEGYQGSVHLELHWVDLRSMKVRKLQNLDHMIQDLNRSWRQWIEYLENLNSQTTPQDSFVSLWQNLDDQLGQIVLCFSRWLCGQMLMDDLSLLEQRGLLWFSCYWCTAMHLLTHSQWVQI